MTLGFGSHGSSHEVLASAPLLCLCTLHSISQQARGLRTWPPGLPLHTPCTLQITVYWLLVSCICFVLVLLLLTLFMFFVILLLYCLCYNYCQAFALCFAHLVFEICLKIPVCLILFLSDSDCELCFGFVWLVNCFISWHYKHQGPCGGL